MGEVWKAYDTHLQRYVAIKLLHADLRNDPSFTARFEREGRVIASLHHPNIVQVHVLRVVRPQKSENRLAYMVMDYVEGQTLASYIAKTSTVQKFPSSSEIVHLFTSISLAIDYAHQRGMIHRDLKPANILLDARNTSNNPMGEPILTDFGIAKMLGTSTGSMSGSWLSTPLYMSPEQAQGYPGNERSDLYSLGIILYEICTGVVPFRGQSPASIMSQQISASPPPPTLINSSIPPALAAVILRSIAKDPSARFNSAASMTAAVAEALNFPVPAILDVPTRPVDPLDGPTEKKSIPPGLLTDLIQSSPPPPPMPLPTNQAVVSPGTGRDTPVSSVQQRSKPHSVVNSLENVPTVIMPQSTQALSSAPIPARRKRHKVLLITLIVLLILTLLGSGLGTFYLLSQRNSVAASQVVGHVFFLSSGQVSKYSNQGIDDELQINLTGIPAPAAGKRYYAWLFSDKKQSLQTSILLTTLTINHGAVEFLFKDPQHTNLLEKMCCFLITQEDANSIPINPSPNRSSWSYYGEIPQIPGSTHFSVLDHLRQLLSDDPQLDRVGLPGGLDKWLVRNTGDILIRAGSAREYWKSQNTDLMRNQLIRILDYLDGQTYVQADVPPGTSLLIDKNIASVALLEFDKQKQDPPGYLDQVGRHLESLDTTPGASVRQRMLADQINTGLNQVTSWLEKVRTDAVQLVGSSPAQLLLPSSLSLLDDMQMQAFFAYVGRLNPSTNEVEPGVTQIHHDLQLLATLDITPYSSP
jgi:serine/threonine protein kinase